MRVIKQIFRHFIKNSLFKRFLKDTTFPGSQIYWERRYNKNGNSGPGSYGKAAKYKAAILNQFVKENNIQSVIEFGSGDGNQLLHYHFSNYTGLDVSATAIGKCRHLFKHDISKQFFLYDEERHFQAELAISVDVIFHLVEENVYERYMQRLFSTATLFVIIYAWDVEGDQHFHVKHRKFSEWIKENVPQFKLFNKIKNSTFSDFYIYRRINQP